MATEGKETIRESRGSRSGSVALRTTDDVNRVEAPVTWQAYLICAFASFGGIFFGYDSGYINGVLGSKIFIAQVEGAGATAITSSHQSLIVSILSCGTFFGAIIAGDVADFIGRKWTVIIGCGIYIFGVVIQIITGPGDGSALGTIVAGRLIAGLGVGFESAIVILYMSEIVSTSSQLSKRNLTFAVPSQGPWSSCRRLPVLHYHRYLVGFRCRVCNQEPNRYWQLPHPDRSSIRLGPYPWYRPFLPPRFSEILRQER